MQEKKIDDRGYIDPIRNGDAFDTTGYIDPVVRWEGHAGKVLQHSQAGGYAWLFVYCQPIHTEYFYCSWPALGLESTYIYIY